MQGRAHGHAGLRIVERLRKSFNANPSPRLRGVPAYERDRVMMAMLRSIGIEKGKPSNPDARQKKTLTDAVLVADKTSRSLRADERRAGAVEGKPSEPGPFYAFYDEKVGVLWF